jgi:Flp pilus assembly protein TadB
VRLVAVCCTMLAAWCLARPSRGLRRVRKLDRVTKATAASPTAVIDSPLARGCLCAGSVALLGWLVAGPVVAGIGLPVGVLLSGWIGRLESPEQARAHADIDRDLPLALDLLAACAAAGRSPEQSLRVVSRAVGGAVATRLDAITARLSLGADPATEWARCASDQHLAGLARAMQRSAESGAPLADGLTRLAEDHRRDRRTRAQVKARNVGVKAAGPLAACFLPAFMLVGVVPTVAGSFRHLFG